jgi:uncharacterized protein YbjT (DUF2867 family)
MSPQPPTVFVCSATGSQGGAVARLLRGLDWNVRATVRDLASAGAADLKALGVHLTQGDWDNTEALSATIAGCDKLFLCLLPNLADLSCERRQAEGILRIAKALGVKQVVASTTLGVSQLGSGIHIEPGSFAEKHLVNKQLIEQAVIDAGFDYATFLRPAFFMANFLEPKNQRYPEVRDKGTWTTAMTAQAQLPLIDHVDIARFAAAAFQNPKVFNHRAIGLASELLMVQETLDKLGEAAGRPGGFKAIFMTDEEIAAQANSNVLVYSPLVMRSMSGYVNLADLATMIPGHLTTFAEFLERERTGVEQTYH